MRIRWGGIEIEVGDPVPLVARRDRPCAACGGAIARGEVCVSLEGHDPASGAVFVAVHRQCRDRGACVPSRGGGRAAGAWRRWGRGGDRVASEVIWSDVACSGDTPLGIAERFAAGLPGGPHPVERFDGGPVHGGAWMGTFGLAGGRRIYWLRGERGRWTIGEAG